MDDFFRAIDIDEKLQDAVNPLIREFDKKKVEDLLRHDRAGRWWICPICWKKIVGFDRFLRHFRSFKSRWEFMRLLRIVEDSPRNFEKHKFDYLYGEEAMLKGKMRNKIWLYVVASKLVERLNPRSYIVFRRELER
jgi:hypothetical protein